GGGRLLAPRASRHARGSDRRAPIVLTGMSSHSPRGNTGCDPTCGRYADRVGTTAAKARVLVVDDDRQSLRLCSSVLAAAGYQVTTAEDGERASRILADEAFDVVLSDIVMPGLDGLRLLEQVRRRDVDPPAILLTSSPDLDGAIRAVEWGALRYLLKPVPLETLERTVAEAARLHQMATLNRELLPRLRA